MSAFEPSAAEPAPAETPKRVKAERGRVLIRSYPKTIFLYPAGLAAAACGVASSVGFAGPETLGFVFVAIFFFNLLIVSFEFRKHTPVVILLVALILVLAGILLNQRFGLLAAIGALYGRLALVANAQFYFGLAIGYALVLFLILLGARLDYWEVRGNEILHHHGILGDCDRFPANSMRIRKEITDIFEYVLLRSGRLVIFPSGRERPIVLDNVPGINSIERRVTDLLDSLQVNIERRDDS